jgi:hypothetical protein
LETLRWALSNNKKIVPVFLSIQPGEYSLEFSATLGQIQGLSYNAAEFDYLLKRSLKDQGCWKNLIEDYDYLVKNNKITIKGYKGDNSAYIPRQCFDPPQVVRIDHTTFHAEKHKEIDKR